MSCRCEPECGGSRSVGFHVCLDVEFGGSLRGVEGRHVAVEDGIIFIERLRGVGEPGFLFYKVLVYVVTVDVDGGTVHHGDVPTLGNV